MSQWDIWRRHVKTIRLLATTTPSVLSDGSHPYCALCTDLLRQWPFPSVCFILHSLNMLHHYMFPLSSFQKEILYYWVIGNHFLAWSLRLPIQSSSFKTLMPSILFLFMPVILIFKGGNRTQDLDMRSSFSTTEPECQLRTSLAKHEEHFPQCRQLSSTETRWWTQKPESCPLVHVPSDCICSIDLWSDLLF